jgi:hypothetical protein
METKLEKLKELLLKRRNVTKVKLYEDAIEEEGFFNAYEYSGGNFDDAFTLGEEVGEAQLIEELLSIISE